MADTPMTFLLEKLTQLLSYHDRLVSGSKNELELLQSELSLLKALLKSEAQKSNQNPKAFGETERKIIGVVYEIEDIIDSYLTQIKNMSSLRRSFSKKRINLAKEVKSITESKLKPISDEVRQSIGNGSGTRQEEQLIKDSLINKEPLIKAKEESHLIREDNIIGFDDAQETLTKYLNEETNELDIISIVGKPGLGKTTLARSIFQSPKIEKEFRTRVWIHVSKEFHRKDLFLRILKAFTDEDMSQMSDLELVLKVRCFLEKGKYLLVMNDIWSTEEWNDIKDIFTKSNSEGKVLITTRDIQVAKLANVNREPYLLRLLTSEKSWELLQVEVFGKLDECPTELVELGRYIAKQCDGLPLAVVVIGKVLKDSLSTIETMSGKINKWKNVAEHVGTQVRMNMEDNISKSYVEMSYNNLHDEIRDCFIYLGVFPQDYEIPASTLTRLWIAEGFVQPQEEQSLEETAEQYLYKLISKNLVRAVKTNHIGEVKTCCVHKVIHDFCILKALEHNIFQEINFNPEVNCDSQISDIKTYRRLCIHSHLDEFLSKKPEGPHLRSFLSFNKVPTILTPDYILSIPDGFNLLRVLESNSFKVTRFPKKVVELIHLRYLTLSCDDLDVLPESISHLWYLQTLLVDTNSPTLTFEANIWKMTQLRHVNTKASIILSRHSSHGEVAGENLQTLGKLSAKSCTGDVLVRARNLKKVAICGKLAPFFAARSLHILDRLENLKLMNGLSPDDQIPLQGLPESIWFPPNLKQLTLSGTHLDWEHMATLRMIDSIEVLKLKDNAFKGDSWNTASGGFLCLRFLLIATTDLIFWKASADHFPTLKCLVLKKCKQLNTIPLCLGENLDILDIQDLSKSATRSARDIEKQKNDAEGLDKGRWGGFKLLVGPGCE